MSRILAAAASIALAAIPAEGMAQAFSYNNSILGDRVDWTGFYLGAHSGGVSGKTTFVRQAKTNTNPGSSFCTAYPSMCGAVNAYRSLDMGPVNKHDVDIDGYHIGPHIGYQRQFGNLVLGADLGFSIGGGEGAKDCSGPAAGPAALSNGLDGFSARCETEYRYSVNVRARVGYATGNWLWYGTVGLTKARIDHEVTFIGTLCCGGGTVGLIERGSSYPNGYVFGVGFEYQTANGMRLGLSYTHILLEDVTVTLRDAAGGNSGNRFRNDPDVLGAALKIPLQQQATQVADPGPPAAQAPAVGQGPVAGGGAAAPRPAAQRPAAPRPAVQPAAAPAARPAAAPRAPATTAPPATGQPPAQPTTAPPARIRRPTGETPPATAPVTAPPTGRPAAPAARPVPRPDPAAPPAAERPVPGEPREPDAPPSTGRPQK